MRWETFPLPKGTVVIPCVYDGTPSSQVVYEALKGNYKEGKGVKKKKKKRKKKAKSEEEDGEDDEDDDPMGDGTYRSNDANPGLRLAL